VASARIVVTSEAEADLLAISAYIAERDGSTRASQVMERIQSTFRNLAFMPGIGRSRSYLEPDRLAFSVRPWTIFYMRLPEHEGIRVLRVVDGRRNLPAIFGRGP
jgi:plasmid stabilization system protein ParE